MQICLEHGENDSGSKCSGSSSPQPESQGRDCRDVAFGLLARETPRDAERPTLAEFREHLHTRKRRSVALDTADLVRGRAVRQLIPPYERNLTYCCPKYFR